MNARVETGQPRAAGRTQGDPEGVGRHLAASLDAAQRLRKPHRRPFPLATYLVLGSQDALADAGFTEMTAGGAASVRACRCWLGGDTVFIEVSDALAAAASPLDAASWETVLSTLHDRQRRFPLKGVIATLAIGVDDADATGTRLREIAARLGSEVGLHVIVAGAQPTASVDAFARRGEQEREGGWTVSLPRATMPELAETLRSGIARVVARLDREMPDRLQGAEDPGIRAQILALPRLLARAGEEVVATVERLAETGCLPRSVSFAAAPLLHRLAAGRMPSDAVGGGAARFRLATAALLAAATIAGLGVMAWDFAVNRSAIVATRHALSENHEAVARTFATAAVTDVDLETIVEGLSVLRDLPVEPSPQRVFDAREKIAGMTRDTYAGALESQLRPRLLLQAEHAVRGGLADPGSLYEPLKVYLALGGRAPNVEDAFVTAWLRRDWEENYYPGADNRDGLDELEAHLRAMLALEPAQPGAAMDLRLVEAAQRSLSLMTLADLAWAQVTAAARAAPLDDYTLEGRAGEIFTARDRSASVSIPALYTAEGFRTVLLPQLGGIAERITDDRWLLGTGGERVGVESALRRLGPDILDRYSREFLAAWNGLLNNLALRVSTSEGPDLDALALVAGEASPLRRLVESVVAGTTLSDALADEPIPEEVAAGLARVGIVTPGAKSQGRAGSWSNETAPGSVIEEHFRPYRMLVDDRGGRRPIDALIQNFADIHRSLLLIENVPAQADHARSNLQLQVHNLRINASRLPRQIARMVMEAADQLEADTVAASLEEMAERLRTTVTEPCNRLIEGAYPFVRGSDRDAPLDEFARLFAPGGEIDRFFAQNLAPFADISRPQWQWRRDDRLGQDLSQTTLQSFQRAAAIRTALFAQGGSRPSMELTVTPFSLHGEAQEAILEVDGQEVRGYQSGNVPTRLEWPGPQVAGSAELRLEPAAPGREEAKRFDGPWALMRLVDTASLEVVEGKLRARFVVGGRDATFTLDAGAAGNPFARTLFSDFRCPDGL